MVQRVGLLMIVAVVAACSTPAPAPAPEPIPCNCPAPEPVRCPEPIPQPVPQCPEPAPAPVCPPAPACPKPAPVSPTQYEGKVVVGEVEFVNIQPGNLRLEARIDSGATTSSLHATDVVRFERDGQRWVRFKVAGKGEPLELPEARTVRIKGEGADSDRRTVVMMEVRLGDHRQRVEVTLNDRSNYEYPALIGRNFLRDHAVVDVSRSYIHGKK